MERAAGTNVHPGIILKQDLIEAAGLSIGRAAELLAVPEQTLSEVVNGAGSDHAGPRFPDRSGLWGTGRFLATHAERV